MRIESESNKYPGYVILPEYLNIAQLHAFQDSLEDLGKINTENQGKNLFMHIRDEKRVPALMACVKEWHIEGFPPDLSVDNFPMTPAPEVRKLILPIFDAIRKIWLGEIEVPNE